MKTLTKKVCINSSNTNLVTGKTYMGDVRGNMFIIYHEQGPPTRASLSRFK